MMAPAMRGLEVAEYPANLVKKSVVGAGHAVLSQGLPVLVWGRRQIEHSLDGAQDAGLVQARIPGQQALRPPAGDHRPMEGEQLAAGRLRDFEDAAIVHPGDEASAGVQIGTVTRQKVL